MHPAHVQPLAVLLPTCLTGLHPAQVTVHVMCLQLQGPLLSPARCLCLQDAAWARAAALPPLQSVMEMTSAYKPPARGEEPAMDMVSSSAGQPPSPCLESTSLAVSGICNFGGVNISGPPIITAQDWARACQGPCNVLLDYIYAACSLGCSWLGVRACLGKLQTPLQSSCP